LETTHTKALPGYSGQPKPTANDCSAYKIRYGKV